jgi:hypothetical protein
MKKMVFVKIGNKYYEVCEEGKVKRVATDVLCKTLHTAKLACQIILICEMFKRMPK